MLSHAQHRPPVTEASYHHYHQQVHNPAIRKSSALEGPAPGPLHQLFGFLCSNSQDIPSVYLMWQSPNVTLV